MINMDVRGFVKVTVHKPSGETYVYETENAIDKGWVAEIYSLLTAGNRYNITEPSSLSFAGNNNHINKGYWLIDEDDYSPTSYRSKVGMPLVWSGQTLTANSVSKRVLVPFVPRQITCVFKQTNHGLTTADETPTDYLDKTNGKSYRYVFGNTRVHFNPDNTTPGGQTTNWETHSNQSNSPRLDEIIFKADGFTPSYAHSNTSQVDNDSGTGCPLHGRRVPTGEGAATENNRGGRHNTIIKLDSNSLTTETVGGQTTVVEVGIQGSDTYRIDSVGLITGYGPGIATSTAHGIVAGSPGVDSFLNDPYRYIDREGERISGSYNRPVFIGQVKDDDSNIFSSSFPNGLSTKTWRGGPKTQVPDSTQQYRWQIDANDTVKFEYKIQIQHDFKEYSVAPGTNPATLHENKYSYRVLSAILKRPIIMPSLSAIDGAGNGFMRTDYGADVDHPAEGNETELVFQKAYKQEYSIEEWRKVCYGVAINGFAVQYKFGSSLDTVEKVNNQANITTATTQGNGHQLVNYSSYTKGIATFNRAKKDDLVSADSTANNQQLGGNNIGSSAGLINTYVDTSNLNGSVFMFPEDNYASFTSFSSAVIKGDSHFIYKGVGNISDSDDNVKPMWCHYFVNYEYPETKIDGEDSQSADVLAAETTSGAGANTMPTTKPAENALLVATVNLQDLETFKHCQTTNQMNNFQSGPNASSTDIARSSTWDDSSGSTNNLMMSHFLSITHTNATTINTIADPDGQTGSLTLLHDYLPPSGGGS